MTIYAHLTGNTGKFGESKASFDFHGFSLVSRDDIGLGHLVDPEETGNSSRENARIKLDYFAEMMRDCHIVQDETVVLILDDTEFEIPALNREPGHRVRTWKDGKTRMTDDEIIDYTVERMRDVPACKRYAKFRTSIFAQAFRPDGSTSAPIYSEGTLLGRIQEKPDDFRIKGKPFVSLFFIPDWNCPLSHLECTPIAQRRAMLSHRERAIEGIVPWLKAQQYG